MTIMDTLGNTVGHPGFISKGWGYEKIIHNCPSYCGKVLHFVAGRRCSAHYHLKKNETFFLNKGSMEIYYFDGPELLKSLLAKDKEHSRLKLYDFMEKVVLTQGLKFEVPVGRVHQMIALEDSELFEFSQQDFPEDSYRIIKGD